MTDVFFYLQGNLRYFLYYYKNGAYRFLLRQHIVKQFEFRLQLMDNQCYLEGQCKICGCKTTALQMADKPCGKPCYPPLMNYADWMLFQLVDMKAKHTFRRYYDSDSAYYEDLYKAFKSNDLSILEKGKKKDANELLYNK